MALPTHAVTLPANLAGQTNGKLPHSLMVQPGFPGRPYGRLHTQAARSWLAFADAVLVLFSETLTVTSEPDAYRSYAIQERMFRERYAIGGQHGGCKQWDSNGDGVAETWCKKLVNGRVPATAAVPGKSNHGWGLAFDVCLWRDRPVAITANTRMFQWMLANAVLYGLSWETQSEPWHLRLFTGDKTPQAVLDFEGGAPQPQPDPTPIPPPAPTPTPPPKGRLTVITALAGFPMLAQGAQGAWVRVLQSTINATSNSQVLTVDGSFGAKTKDTVVWCQGANGLPATGVVDLATWAVLYPAA